MRLKYSSGRNIVPEQVNSHTSIKIALSGYSFGVCYGPIMEIEQVWQTTVFCRVVGGIYEIEDF